MKDNCVAIYENLFERKKKTQEKNQIVDVTLHTNRRRHSETNFVVFFLSFHFFFRSLPHNVRRITPLMCARAHAHCTGRHTRTHSLFLYPSRSYPWTRVHTRRRDNSTKENHLIIGLTEAQKRQEDWHVVLCCVLAVVVVVDGFENDVPNHTHDEHAFFVDVVAPSPATQRWWWRLLLLLWFLHATQRLKTTLPWYRFYTFSNGVLSNYLCFIFIAVVGGGRVVVHSRSFNTNHNRYYYVNFFFYFFFVSNM